MAGPPSTSLVTLSDPDRLACTPEKIPYIKPRLKIAQGDAVKIGTLLFEDKRNPKFRFLSPAGGAVRRIQFGPRRVIRAIVIERDKQDEASEQFAILSGNDIESMERLKLVEHILEGGLWWVFRQLPFRDLPDPETVPPVIIVGLSAKEPYQPSPNVYLQDRMDLMAFGVKVLQKLSGNQVMIFHNGDTPPPEEIQALSTHMVRGNYPSDDPGTFLYHVKTSPEQNRAWFVSGQDLLLLAQLLAQGRYPTDRIVSIGGSRAPTPQHVRTRLGAPLSHLVDIDAIKADTRFVVGGLFTGYASDRYGFMGQYETALNLLPEGSEAEFLTLFNPGLRKPTYSRTFLSCLNPGPLVYDCNLKGGERACIACMHCADVCPVDIMPHMAYKAVLADEVEEYLEHGLLDCVNCGLCSYVCPSKIELTRTFIDAKAGYLKEQGD